MTDNWLHDTIDPAGISFNSAVKEAIVADVLAEIACWNYLRGIPEPYIRIVVAATLLNAARRGFTQRPAP
ncbi:hypothetical protein RA307_04960 [Xanthobacteraceae bacterium Astr-EGSB]|uniref:hypothetical protein n=1 Tax=Astrobacterium formosum TaxID=3069710 RepID=UPI0027AF997C|nr:hypothetical protein [Xanthobacteraceae bacterium Astr-EGSB]